LSGAARRGVPPMSVAGAYRRLALSMSTVEAAVGRPRASRRAAPTRSEVEQRRPCEDEADPRPVAGHARVGALEDVVDDDDVVDRVREVELLAADLVDAEAVVRVAETLALEQPDQVLVTAAKRIHPARQRALEPVPPDRQVGTEAAVDEVAAVAVVEPVVCDDNVSRPVPEEQAVRPRGRAVAAVREFAPHDRDEARVGNDDRGTYGVPSALTTSPSSSTCSESWTTIDASPEAGASLSPSSETRCVRSKRTRSARAPLVATMRSGRADRSGTTSCRYARGSRTIVPPELRSAATAVGNSASLRT